MCAAWHRAGGERGIEMREIFFSKAPLCGTETSWSNNLLEPHRLEWIRMRQAARTEAGGALRRNTKTALQPFDRRRTEGCGKHPVTGVYQDSHMEFGCVKNVLKATKRKA